MTTFEFAEEKENDVNIYILYLKTAKYIIVFGTYLATNS